MVGHSTANLSQGAAPCARVMNLLSLDVMMDF
jgi:hypothetical protein